MPSVTALLAFDRDISSVNVAFLATSNLGHTIRYDSSVSVTPLIFILKMDVENQRSAGSLSWRLSSHPITLMFFLGFRICELPWLERLVKEKS